MKKLESSCNSSIFDDFEHDLMEYSSSIKILRKDISQIHKLKSCLHSYEVQIQKQIEKKFREENNEKIQSDSSKSSGP